MNLRKTRWALVVALVLCATPAFAQDQKQDRSPIDPNAPLQPLVTSPSGRSANKPPIGAARGVSGPNDSQPYDPSQVTPDTNTLAGGEDFGLGSLEHSHNIFDPWISASILGENFSGTTVQSSLGGVALLVGGGLNFIHNWSRYRLTASYNGGGNFNIGSASVVAGQNASQYQDLTFVQEVNWARWHVLLRDDFIASPSAAFTGSGTGGPGLLGQSSSLFTTFLPSVGQSFAPVQTIETGYAMRYMNSVLGQAEYSISRKSTVTFSGSYGILHFPGAGFISSNMLNAQAGCDYLLDPVNSIAIFAGYGKIDYTGTVDTTTNYTAGLAYGRKITGRLAFQLSAGPQEIQSAGTSAFGNFRELSYAVNTALTYQRRRSGFSFSYMHGGTAGQACFWARQAIPFPRPDTTSSRASGQGRSTAGMHSTRV